jgi:xylulokinase
MALLGIDLGTSSVKVLMLDRQGHTLSTSRADYEVRSPYPGWAESEPQEWWRATVVAVREAMRQVSHDDITAIGLSGQMHGVVPVGEQGVPTRAALLWADDRAEAELGAYRILPAGLRQRLANPLVSGMAGPLLCWLMHHEAAAYQATRWALQPKDWLRFCLTNTIASDPSDASATLLYDMLADDWSDEVVEGLGLRRSLFPVISPSASVAGVLTSSAAQALGLSEGLIVAVGAGDTAAAALGTGLLDSDLVQLTMGTGAQLIQLYQQPAPDASERTHLYRSADALHWYAMAAVQNAGLALDWVRRMFGASWDELYASADTVVPGSEGVIFLPYLTRERPHHQNPHSRGGFLNMRINHRREHLLHAALEGVALGIREALEALPGGSEMKALRVAGGGSVHPAWRQMLADILGRELIAVDASDASARGAALLGGIADGVWSGVGATASIAPATQVVAVPDRGRVLLYERVYEEYLGASTSL